MLYKRNMLCKEFLMSSKDLVIRFKIGDKVKVVMLTKSQRFENSKGSLIEIYKSVDEIPLWYFINSYSVSKLH